MSSGSCPGELGYENFSSSEIKVSKNKTTCKRALQMLREVWLLVRLGAPGSGVASYPDSTGSTSPGMAPEPLCSRPIVGTCTNPHDSLSWAAAEQPGPCTCSCRHPCRPGVGGGVGGQDVRTLEAPGPGQLPSRAGVKELPRAPVEDGHRGRTSGQGESAIHFQAHASKEDPERLTGAVPGR